LRRIDTALNVRTNPLLREYGMEFDASGMAEPALAELLRRGLISPTQPVTITDVGQRHLTRALRHRL
jgi:hypothetical protein